VPSQRARAAPTPGSTPKDRWRTSRSLVVRRDRPLRSPSTCVDLLHVALWANWNDPTFEEAVQAAQDLTGDAWACAAAGAVAAARLGRVSIPPAALARIPGTIAVDAMAERYVSLLICLP